MSVKNARLPKAASCSIAGEALAARSRTVGRPQSFVGVISAAGRYPQGVVDDDAVRPPVLAAANEVLQSASGHQHRARDVCLDTLLAVLQPQPDGVVESIAGVPPYLREQS